MKHIHWGSLLLGAGVLAVSAALTGGLLTFKRTPAEATAVPAEKPIHVVVETVQPSDEPVWIEGFGTVAALRTLAITPEVSGQVLSVHPSLVAGGLVSEGDLLFEIDSRPYTARVADATAQVKRQETALERLRTEEDHAKADIKTLGRTLELAREAHERARKLFDGGVGSRAAVDQAEQSLVTVQNDYNRVLREISLYPIRAGEAESDLASARARLQLAEVDLDHTRVLAPFSGRVKDEQLEANAVVSAGSHALSLVDDSVLEIAVPLNSQDARQWLPFEADAGNERAWFDPLRPAVCAIRWTEGAPGHQWEGNLDRVAAYDEQSRTLTVIIRVAGAQRRSSTDHFPLVEGMFCTVRIPGREMRGVYRLPSHAVTFEDTVYVARENRLVTVPVTVSRIEEDFTYVSNGLAPGDQVITTRLVNPLDHTLLTVVESAGAPAA